MAVDNTMQVTVPNYGTLQGSVDHARQIAVFRNVPYAVVPERWRPAVKPEPWTGVRDATKQGPICPQLPSKYPLTLLVPKDFPPYGTGKHMFGLDHDEFHGLNLNIFVPLQSVLSAGAGAEKIPVMTWIHGGANRDGSNAIPLYDAVSFVQRSIQLQKPVIVVAVNYRVNLFGFLASRELEQDLQENSPSDTSVGNWGLQDQKLAFQWVRDNISVFGGNPYNVTAFGESAGSIALHYHMLSPSHWGLFDHAILQSGTVATIPPGLPHKDGQIVFEKLLQKFNIPQDLDWKEKIRRLRAVTTDELSLVCEDVMVGVYKPHYDHGKVIPSQIPIQTLAKDVNAYDPNLKSVLIGANRDEGSVFASIFGDRNMQAWPFMLKKLVPVPELQPLFEAVYGAPETDADVVRITARYTADYMFLHPTEVLTQTFLELSRKKGVSEFKALRYHFDVSIEAMERLVPGLGAMHAGELPFLFSPPIVEQILTPRELELGKEMQDIWIAFANQQNILIKSNTDISGKLVQKEPELEKDEAIVIGEDREIRVGKSTRLSKEALMYWDKVAFFKEQNDKAALQAWGQQ
ncbi:hypothetical protein EDD11_007504 [Mortierella claussenii]|nr:hypothetical protein EDD11_007504 [Mortierella claussenii]